MTNSFSFIRGIRVATATALALLLSVSSSSAALFTLSPGDILGINLQNVVRINPETGARETLVQLPFIGGPTDHFQTDYFGITQQRTVLLQSGSGSAPPAELFELKPETGAITRISRYAESYFPVPNPISLRDPFGWPSDAPVTFIEPSGSVLVQSPFGSDLIRFDPVTRQSSIVRSSWSKVPKAVLPSGRIVSQLLSSEIYEAMAGSNVDRSIAFSTYGFDLIEPYSANEIVVYTNQLKQFDIMNIDTGQRQLFATIQGSVTPRDFVVTPSGSLLVNDFTNLYKLQPGATQAVSLGFSGSVSHMLVVPVPEPATLTLAVLTASMFVLRRRDPRL